MFTNLLSRQSGSLGLNVEEVITSLLQVGLQLDILLFNERNIFTFQNKNISDSYS